MTTEDTTYENAVRNIRIDRTPLTGCALCGRQITVWHINHRKDPMWTSGQPYVCIRCTREVGEETDTFADLEFTTNFELREEPRS